MSGDEVALAALSRQIASVAGVTADVYKDKCLRRRIGVRMRACGVHTLDDYLAILEQTPAEQQRLRDTLTINVTRFYRNRETWALLRERVLPELWEARAGRLLAWSAGCASGEEPYTLALLIAEIARERRESERLNRVQIDATDVDSASLERAANGVYRTDALSELPPELTARYLAPDGAGHRIAREVRERVSVRYLDLGADRPLRTSYDLILCRNVVIYFDRAMQERLFLTFVRHLSPGGVLVLGKVETLLGPARDQLQLVDARERIYRRAS